MKRGEGEKRGDETGKEERKRSEVKRRRDGKCKGNGEGNKRMRGMEKDKKGDEK